MALNKIILNISMKCAIDVGVKEGQRDKNVDVRPTKY